MPRTTENVANIETVGILGAGTIGASWTALFAACGYQVDVYDPSPEGEAYVRDYVETAWPALQELDLVRTDVPKLSFFPSAAEAVKRAQFVQESVPERLPIKHDIYQQIEPALAPEAVVATSASGLLVKDMQKGWRDPSRFILAHPFNPPHLIPLVELLGNEHTADGVLDLAEAFFESCGKVTIRVNKEVPGHVSNRLQAALWREAIHLVMEGVASVEDVDKAVWAGPGLRWSVMGPHMLFSLASGGHGIGTFCERYGDSFHTWWDTMGSPKITPKVGQTLADGIADAEKGRDFASISGERDAKIIGALQAFKKVDKDLEA